MHLNTEKLRTYNIMNVRRISKLFCFALTWIILTFLMGFNSGTICEKYGLDFPQVFIYLFILSIYLFIHLFIYLISSLFKVDVHLTYKKTINVNNNTAYIYVNKLPNNNETTYGVIK